MTNVSRETYGPGHFFDLDGVWFASIFDTVEFPWEVLRPNFKEDWILTKIKRNTDKIERKGSIVTEDSRFQVDDGEVFVEAGAIIVGDDIQFCPGVVVESTAYVTGPTILWDNTSIRHGAYVRGGVITGKKAIIGHASEIKSSILFNGARAPHFAYVGDSILGNRVNLGAGTKVSNLKMTNDEVILKLPEGSIKSGLRKFGAIVGDHTETGCNSVLNPGVLLGKNCMVYPATAVRKNYYKSKSVVK